MDKKVIEAGKFNRQTDAKERDKLLLRLLREVLFLFLLPLLPLMIILHMTNPNTNSSLSLSLYEP